MDEVLRLDFASVTESCPNDLTMLVNSNIVLTGASGFVGKWFVGSWIAACNLLGGTGYLLVTCRRPEILVAEFPEIKSNKRVMIVSSDIRKFNIEQSFCPDIVIHAATAASEQLNLEDPLEMIDVILSGTRNLLKIVGPKITRKFVFLSSGAVYGMGHLRSSPVPETSLTGPDITDAKHAYHEAKRLAEILVQVEAKQRGLQAVILRPFSFLAPYLPLEAHFAAGNFLLQAVKGADIVITSGGSSVRTYQYGSDFCRFLVAASVRETRKMVYNVGSTHQTSILALANRVAAIVNSGCCVRVNGFDTPNTRTNYVPLTDRIEDEFKISNQINLDSSIERTANWIRNRMDR